MKGNTSPNSRVIPPRILLKGRSVARGPPPASCPHRSASFEGVLAHPLFFFNPLLSTPFFFFPKISVLARTLTPLLTG